MKKFAMMMIFGATAAVACVPTATQQECAGACDNQAKLQGPAADLGAEVTAKVAAEFAPRLADAEKLLVDELGKIDAEMQPKLAKAKGTAKDALVAEIAKSKADKTAELQLKIDELNEAKTTAIVAAESKSVAEAKTAAEQALETCIADCMTAQTRKSKADCQAQAASQADFAACK